MDAEEREIYFYLKSCKHEYVSSREICRRAGGKRRFHREPEWAKPAINRMVERGIIEMDGAGHYRLKPPEDNRSGKKKRWVSPQIQGILRNSGKDFSEVVMTEDDLDRYYDGL
jgi:hypothetical protein